ncbi:MAG TPA: CAP domain-containing protein [Acidimicrobiales bacterium]|nr:CAP domain-containing protein [Acidimicrobiales bacterium]
MHRPSRGRSRHLVVAVLAVVLVVLVPAPASADPGVEAEFVRLTNAERAQGLSVDGELTSVARRWSARMAADNRLAHNPNLSKEVTQDWGKLGENVGTGATAGQIHDAFMNSPAHRANIVDRDFTHVGIGVVRGDDGRIWVTEVFMKLRSGGGTAPAPPPPAPVTTARPPAPVQRPPGPSPTTTAVTTTSTTAATTTTTTTVPLPPAPPEPGAAEHPPRYVLVLEGLARLDPGRGK